MQAVANGDVIDRRYERREVRVGLLAADPIFDGLGGWVFEIIADGGGTGAETGVTRSRA